MELESGSLTKVFATRSDLLVYCFDALERAGFPLVVLHGYEGMPEHIPSDVDVAIGPCRRRDFERELVAILEGTNASLVNIIRHEYTCYFYVLCLATEARGFEFLQIDLAYDFRRDGRIHLSGAELVDGARRHKTLLVAEPRVSYAYYLLKRIGKGSIGPDHAASLQLACATNPAACRVQLDRFWGKHAVDVIFSASSSGDWEQVYARVDDLRSDLLRSTARKRPARVLQYYAQEFLRLSRRVMQPTGLFLAVYGPDGSGKSTALAEATEVMLPAFRRTSVNHWRPYVLGGRRRGASGGDNPHGGPQHSVVSSSAKAAYLLCDFVLGYWVRTRPALVRSTLVVFDRYASDLLIDPVRYRYSGPRWLARVVAMLAPRPDVSVVLSCGPEVLFGRTPDSSMEILTGLVLEYEALAEAPGFLQVDADRERAEVVADVCSAVASALRARTLERVWRGRES